MKHESGISHPVYTNARAIARAASHFAATPRITCPAINIFAQDLYGDILSIYQTCMTNS